MNICYTSVALFEEIKEIKTLASGTVWCNGVSLPKKRHDLKEKEVARRTDFFHRVRYRSIGNNRLASPANKTFYCTPLAILHHLVLYSSNGNNIMASRLRQYCTPFTIYHYWVRYSYGTIYIDYYMLRARQRASLRASEQYGIKNEWTKMISGSKHVIICLLHITCFKKINEVLCCDIIVTASKYSS